MLLFLLRLHAQSKTTKNAQYFIVHFSFLGKLPADTRIITVYIGPKRKEDDLKYDR